LARWQAFAKEHPQGYLYCFRGGLRSRIAQGWIAEAGIDYPLVIGGYKALRRFLIDTLETEIKSQPLILVSGRTGSGKTRLLEDLPKFVDLEGLARHRGSSFGQTLTPQPSQIDFENALAIDLLKAGQKPGPLYLEDESRLVGRCALPLNLREAMAQAPMIVLERPLDERIQIILEDYVIDMTAAFQRRDGEASGFANFRQFLRDSLGRLRRRLGGERQQRLDAIMSEALNAQETNGDLEGHRIWIREMLTDYYDPMYDYQLSKRAGEVLQRGGFDDLQRWAERDQAG
jgi:tRNA 2-selenouridine synthase